MEYELSYTAVTEGAAARIAAAFFACPGTAGYSNLWPLARRSRAYEVFVDVSVLRFVVSLDLVEKPFEPISDRDDALCVLESHAVAPIVHLLR